MTSRERRVGRFSRTTAPSIKLQWVPTLLAFSPSISRRVPEGTDTKHLDWLIEQGALAEHPQGGTWYVTQAFAAEWQKHHDAAEQAAEAELDAAPEPPETEAPATPEQVAEAPAAPAKAALANAISSLTELLQALQALKSAL